LATLQPQPMPVRTLDTDIDMNADPDEIEIEILSYREFCKRRALAAWRKRQRAYEHGSQRTEARSEESITRQELPRAARAGPHNASH
jgi:hypothetical protein